ncbi:MAG: glycosyltransferase family 87 protein [Chloroflexota bacterium]|jgi:arabinofuranan 3-O-arabinosyltransferase
MSSRERRCLAAVITVWAILLSLFVFTARPWYPDAPLRNDFIAFWTGASLVHQGNGADLYDMEAQAAFQRELRARLELGASGAREQRLIPYHNPPALALLMAPMATLPFNWGYLLWSILQAVAFLVAVAIPLRGSPGGRGWALLLLTFPAVADTLVWGQMVGFLLLIYSLALVALGANRPVLGGALLGLLWLKPQYGMIFPLVLLIKRRWRELAGMVATGSILVIFSFVAAGPLALHRYLELLQRIGGYYPPAESLVKEYAMVNWRSALAHLLPGLPETTGSFLVLLLGGVTVLISLLVWRGAWEPSSPRFAGQALALTLATLIAAPHSHFHGTAMLLAPLALVLGRVELGTGLSRKWRLMFAGGYLLALVVWPFTDLAWLVAPFFMFAVLLLIRENQISKALQSTSPSLS